MTSPWHPGGRTSSAAISQGEVIWYSRHRARCEVACLSTSEVFWSGTASPYPAPPSPLLAPVEMWSLAVGCLPPLGQKSDLFFFFVKCWFTLKQLWPKCPDKILHIIEAGKQDVWRVFFVSLLFKVTLEEKAETGSTGSLITGLPRPCWALSELGFFFSPPFFLFSWSLRRYGDCHHESQEPL